MKLAFGLYPTEDPHCPRTDPKRRRGRPAGEGVYAITLGDGQMHLVYALELPHTPSGVQKALNIAAVASFALVKS